MRTPRLAIAATVSATLASTPAQAQQYGVNLLVNSGAESGLSAAPPGVAAPAGWRASGSVTQWRYGSGANELTAADPGPPDRGSAYFAGGSSMLNASMTQLVDLSALASDVDGARVRYTLSGWLGGWGAQNDRAQLSVLFFAQDGGVLGAAAVGPVTSTERLDTTQLMFRQADGGVPPGTRSAVAEVYFWWWGGADNDGYADTLSLQLTGPGSNPADGGSLDAGSRSDGGAAPDGGPPGATTGDAGPPGTGSNPGPGAPGIEPTLRVGCGCGTGYAAPAWLGLLMALARRGLRAPRRTARRAEAVEAQA